MVKVFILWTSTPWKRFQNEK